MGPKVGFGVQTWVKSGRNPLFTHFKPIFRDFRETSLFSQIKGGGNRSSKKGPEAVPTQHSPRSYGFYFFPKCDYCGFGCCNDAIAILWPNVFGDYARTALSGVALVCSLLRHPQNTVCNLQLTTSWCFLSFDPFRSFLGNTLVAH